MLWGVGRGMQPLRKELLFMEIGERIRYFRRKCGYSMEGLAQALGISRQTVHRYESGVIENIPRAKIARMAELFGTTSAQLLGFEDSVFAFDGILPVCRRRVPILGEIACGTPVYADEYIESYAVENDGLGADFCLRARGDSMTGARIFDGDLVFVRACSSVENGEIGVVVIEDEATLKRVYYYPEKEKLVLLPENAAYEPLVYLGSELEGIKIIGKAVAFQGRL